MEPTEANIGIAKKLEGAGGLVSNGKYNEARTLLENTISKVEDSGNYDKGECFEFAGPIEQILYIQKVGVKEAPKQAQEPVASLYTTYGKLLLGLGESYKARQAFELAKVYNPVSPSIMMEYADTFRAEGDMDQFFKETLDIFQNVYASKELARLYGNLGYYYIEKEKWTEAMGCYLMSLHYDNKNEDAKKEIAYIQKTTNGDAGVPSIDDFRKVADENNIPVGPNNDIVAMAAGYGHRALSDGRKDVAHYFLSIVYDLTGDEELFNTLKDIEEEIAAEAK